MSAAASTTVSLTNSNWELEGDVIMVTPGAAGSASSTVCGVGAFYSSLLSQSVPLNGTKPCYGGGASPGTVSIQTDITQYINVTCTCNTSNASNTVTLQQLLVFGLN
jgi:hypothetical protein